MDFERTETTHKNPPWKHGVLHVRATFCPPLAQSLQLARPPGYRAVHFSRRSDSGSQNFNEVLLMKSTTSGHNAIQYREHAFRYDSDALLELETEFVRELSEGKQYRQKRSANLKRRKAPNASNPGCGMAGRRNRRWSW